MATRSLNLILKLTGSIAAVSIAVLASNGLVKAQGRTTVNIDGSSTVFPIAEAMAEEFKQEDPSVAVTVGVSGTGGGFKRFCAGEIDIVNASRPIKQAEADLCRAAGIEYMEIPVAYDAITIVVNHDNNWLENITTDQLKKLWEPAAEGKVERWSDLDPSWPTEAVNLYGPGTDSGTFDYFTEVIVGTTDSSRGDYTASEDDNVLVLGVGRDTNALGYFGLAYYLENTDAVKAVAVNGVLPSAATVTDGTYKPLSRPLFMYVTKSSSLRPEVQNFINFYFDEASNIVPDVGYVPLEPQRYQEVSRSFRLWNE